MKTYEKPALNALSLSGNSLLCGCEHDIVQPIAKDDLIGQGINASLTEAGLTLDQIAHSFATGETCSYSLDSTQYCKHTPESAPFKVFSS